MPVRTQKYTVTLRARVWVEIDKAAIPAVKRGTVTLRARVWVEISIPTSVRVGSTVTLRARVWVEISAPPVPSAPLESPSVRGCGLKCNALGADHSLAQSPSVRGCGLKYSKSFLFIVICESPSVRGCGLKWLQVAGNSPWSDVTLRARVWVEIVPPEAGTSSVHVTLRARVWVEIRPPRRSPRPGWSPSVRGCGLKSVKF